MGMSTAYGITNRHGGKIEVKSEEGKGSTFTLQFPATITRDRLITHTETKQETNKKNLHISGSR
ncbi:MAG: HAMP domain-containing histidine kinase [Planctomycetes bacterium]|nr:HAMP domain-containing histidine kinase [Planctomycetota bacterium]